MEWLVVPLAVVVAEHVVGADDDACRASGAQTRRDDLGVKVSPMWLVDWHQPSPSSLIFSSTFSACPSARTVYQARCTTPFASSRKVDLIVPTVFLPYMVFSPQAPYAVMTVCSGSDKSGNLREYFCRKRW